MKCFEHAKDEESAAECIHCLRRYGENWLSSSVEYIRKMNLGIMSYYKRENMKFSQGTNMDRLFLDFYDLEKIKLKELEAFRDTL